MQFGIIFPIERDEHMKYVHLGRSGLKVSRLCLGTMNFGPETAEADSRTIMDRALEEENQNVSNQRLCRSTSRGSA